MLFSKITLISDERSRDGQAAPITFVHSRRRRWLLALSNGSTRPRAMGSFSPRTAAETCSSISPLSSVPALVLSTRVKRSNIRLSVIAARSLRTTLRSVDRDWSLASSRPPTRAAAARRLALRDRCRGRILRHGERPISPPGGSANESLVCDLGSCGKKRTGDQERASDPSGRGVWHRKRKEDYRVAVAHEPSTRTSGANQ